MYLKNKNMRLLLKCNKRKYKGGEMSLWKLKGKGCLTFKLSPSADFESYMLDL
jgi:hypothetical protein